MPLFKKVNGVKVQLTDSEEQETRARWATTDAEKLRYKTEDKWRDERMVALRQKELLRYTAEALRDVIVAQAVGKQTDKMKEYIVKIDQILADYPRP